MARIPGSKNKVPVGDEMDNECTFLLAAVKSYIFWKNRIKELESEEQPCDMERDYAKAFKIQIHAFTADENDEQ